MVQLADLTLPELYVEDETAWLESMAALIDSGSYSELDFASLQEYLTDMARRDRREVRSRLVVLWLHILKWEHQSDQRCRSWQSTIVEQQQELRELAGKGVLRTHAEAILSEVYRDAVDRAVAETGLTHVDFPVESPATFDELLSFATTGENN